MSYNREIVIVAGGRGNRWQLIPALVGRGYAVAHVDFFWPADMTGDFSLCAETFPVGASMREIIDRLANYKVIAVFCGFENSLELADELAEYNFILSRNNIALSGI